MIRLFLLAAGFLSITIALLMSQMGDPTDPGAAGSGVTRSDTSVFGLTGSAEVESQPRVVRSAASTAETEFASSPGASSSDASPIDLMTQTILQELRRPVTGDRLRDVARQTQGEQSDMRALTDGVLAGLGTPAGASSPSDANDPQTLNSLIIKAMREEQSDEYVDALLDEAVGSGRVRAPASIITPTGDVDTATLLDSLVQRSFETHSTTTAQTPAPAAQAPAPEGDLFYVVQPGDSLAGIALRHYGTTTAHDIIFMANRNRLPTPSAVKPGMTLRIPAL